MSLCDLRGKEIRSKQKFYDKTGAINLTVKVAFSIDTVIYPQLIVRTGKNNSLRYLMLYSSIAALAQQLATTL